MLRRKYWRHILICALIAIISGVCYAGFISHKIYEESTGHLKEIYAEVQKEFTSVATANWNMLMDWDEYLMYGLGDLESDQLDKYFQADKARWGYTEVYFLDDSGDYLTLDRRRGHLDCDAQIRPLLEKNQNVVMDAEREDGSLLTVFAIPANPGTYHGFPYTVIAVSYDNLAMAEAVNVTAFSGELDCFMLYPDGHVMLSTSPLMSPSQNFTSYLESHSNLSRSKISSFSRDLLEGKPGILQYRAEGISHYLIYQPSGFHNWMMIGSVPKKAVNTNIPQLQIVTILALSIIFVSVAAISVIYLIRRNKETLEAQTAELQYQEELFTILVCNSPDIFLLYSREQDAIDYISPNIERLLGITPEFIGDDLRRFNVCAVHAEHSLLNLDLSKVKDTDRLQADSEWFNKHTEERHHYHETLYPVRLRGYEKLLLVLSDRTTEWQNHQQLELALDIAKSANEAKSSFLSNMSHDIRTPMNAVLGFAALLQEDAENPDKVRDYTSKITAAGQHLLGIINDVLDMSKIESGKLVLHVKKFDLQELLVELRTMILPLTTAHHQSFTIQTNNLWCKKLWGDPLRISQILLNLLSNAVKYTPDGGNISLSVSMDDSASRSRVHLLFQVEDDGIGMEADFLHTIFEPFTREIGKIQNTIQGTGLGMAITKNLVDLMGGRISVESIPDIGSLFSVELELRKGDGVPAKRTHPEISMIPDFPDFSNPADFPGLSSISSVSETPSIPKHPDHSSRTKPQETPAAAKTVPQEKESETEDKPLAGLHLLVAEDNAFNAEIMEDLLALKGATCEIASTGTKAVELFTSSVPGQFDAILMDVQMPDMDGYEATRRIRRSDHPESTSITIIAITANAFAEDIQTALSSGMNAHLPKPVDLEALCRLLRAAL